MSATPFGGWSAPFEQKERAGRVSDRSLADDSERLAEGGAEAIDGVVLEDVAPRGKEAASHRVLLRDKRDDGVRRHSREQPRHAGKRHVVADRQVVDEGQREDYVRRTALQERGTLLQRPTDGGRRIREIQ